MPGSWKPLNNPPTFDVDSMLLLTDGSIMCHEYRTPNWHKLVPDAASDYANGTWHTLSAMPNNAPLAQNGPTNAPLYFASAVLRDGTVFCAGGEYNGASQPDMLAAELYDPVNDVWTPIATPVGWTNIGDASSCVFPDGRLLLGNANVNAFPNATAIWDPESGSWSAGGNSIDLNSEAGWTLLSDGTVLSVQCVNVPNAQKYVIATNQWVSAGNTGQVLPGRPVNVPPIIYEMGPQVLLPDGRVFAVGASGHTAFYTPPNTLPTDPGSWAAGPDIPVDSGGQLMAAVDAPACLLPNGNVLCVVGPVDGAGWSDPTQFFEFNPTTAVFIPVAAPAIAGITPTYNCRLLLLPTGQVLLSATSDGGTFDLQIYTPAGGPQPNWRPHITHVPRRLHRGRTYRLHGRQLNGLSQACVYGDDQQMATNYPLVRLWGEHGVGAVYCRTFDHSTMGVATGNVVHHTHFEVPGHLPHGEYHLVVIANGIESQRIEVHVERDGHHHRDYEERDHDDRITQLEDDHAKYKDKDAKEVKEKDFKDSKEKETKEFKDKEKDCKESEHKSCKEKEHKEFEQKGCKEKEHKEFEHKGCKEKEHKELDTKGCKDKEHKEHKEKDGPEHSYSPQHHQSRDHDELLSQIRRLGERIEHIGEEARRRAFIRDDERPHVGDHAMRTYADPRRHIVSGRELPPEEAVHRDDDEHQSHGPNESSEEEHRGKREERARPEARTPPPGPVAPKRESRSGPVSRKKR